MIARIEAEHEQPYSDLTPGFRLLRPGRSMHEEMSWKPSRGMRVAGLGVIALLFHLHGQLGLGGHALDNFAFDWYGTMIGGAVCRVGPRDTGQGQAGPLVCSASGLISFYYSLRYSGARAIRASVADALYLYYPTAYVALVLLMRERMAGSATRGWTARSRRSQQGGRRLFDPIVHVATQGDAHGPRTWPIRSEPAGSGLRGFALCGWRPGRSWLLLGIGLATASADTFYVWASTPRGATSCAGSSIRCGLRRRLMIRGLHLAAGAAAATARSGGCW